MTVSYFLCVGEALSAKRKPRALIIGANGFLGSYAVRAATNEFEVVRGLRSAHDRESVAIDIGDTGSVERAFEACKPNVVMLLAAMADIDRCEMQPDLAFAVNVRGAENVANACAKTGARLVFTSTAAVFDGRKRGYSEADPVSPLSVYGSTKVRAEAVVQALVPTVVIVRVSLALGFARRSNANSLVNVLIDRWKVGQAVHLPTFEYRNPIHVDSLGQILARFLGGQFQGIYHIGASDCVSRYELGRRLARRGGFPEDFVQPQGESVPNRAPRGEHHFLLTHKLQELHVAPPQSCDDAIERCFS